MRRAPTVTLAAATTLLLTAAPALAHGDGHGHDDGRGGRDPGPPPVTELAGDLVSPLSVAAGPHGTTYVTQNFAGQLTAVGRDGDTEVLHTSQDGEEVGGVSFSGRTVTFTETLLASPEEPIASSLWTLRLDRHGDPVGAARQVADLRAYEDANNPDGDVTYGFRDTDQACLDQVPDDTLRPQYPGVEDSHPYATTRGWGATYVADAGMNALVSVGDSGRVRTVAVLPAQPTVVTAQGASDLGLPDCVVGETYWFEPVPTDVEVGPWGQLYVSTLPGGPEDDSLGARGSVYRVNPWTGSTHRVATDLLGATNVAVSPWGGVYVAEMFGGEITRVAPGRDRTVVEAQMPGALEWHRGGLLATTDVLPPDDTTPPDGRLVHVDLVGGK